MKCPSCDTEYEVAIEHTDAEGKIVAVEYWCKNPSCGYFEIR
jgi:hypothetical protein